MMKWYKEVYFHEYCKKCTHYVKDDIQKEPCFECLSEPARQYTHKPLKYEEKKKVRK